ncbi:MULTISPECIES: hypothetical protein [Clostridium]|uniref:hypothetical protein n=1 Tax=Clostridium TaxID=1485 RepID=UPI0005FB2F9F|nr:MULTISPECIES: hypothetical protein [Clostridium]KJZ84392.1 hypothetical protein ClosIBUN125C_CONTIG62g03388 [Clostridium sp. IBUN125C]KJZ94830.1 hypothetical protein ClosIBUN62F_CONTIG24g00934 [Clostridium sp. IBUN62F]KJZ96583.1 hypothetical protein ClosIBUN13A_CONTIG154g02369 [Clostridium sp. IBUN13A]KJZ96813.1 hypothetical protein ClosIBUN22A_CONTIG102g02137 [Clostridium sp. IBUN22A]MDU2897135.1 hypothetical protein [Clostridium sp.]
MNYESMSLIEVINYINLELSQGRTMKDIEERDFMVSKGVITKRLNRKGYKKIDNKFIFDENIKNTTKKTTKILQSKPSIDKPKKAFSNDELEKLERLLNLDIGILEKIIKEYTTKNTTVSSIKVTDETTKVTSIRINQELYAKIKKYAKGNKLQLVDIFSEMMIDYLEKHKN